jgi:hypothetical protein
MRPHWSSLSQNKFRRIFSAPFDGRESVTDSNSTDLLGFDPSRIATCVMQLPIDRQGQQSSRRIAKAMMKLGWKTRAVRVVSSKPDDFLRGWVETQVAPPVDSENSQLSFDIK